MRHIHIAQAEDAITLYRACASAFGGGETRDEWLETMKEQAGYNG